MNTIKPLLQLLAIHGGAIVNSAALSPFEIRQARASGRIYVDENNYGFVWEPPMELCMPLSPEQVENFERWYPLPAPMPKKMKDPKFIQNILDRTRNAPQERPVTI